MNKLDEVKIKSVFVKIAKNKFNKVNKHLFIQKSYKQFISEVRNELSKLGYNCSLALVMKWDRRLSTSKEVH